jgi:hypothetical protein
MLLMLESYILPVIPSPPVKREGAARGGEVSDVVALADRVSAGSGGVAIGERYSSTRAVTMVHVP